MIGFIGLFNTARGYTLQFTVTGLLVPTVTSSLTVARWRLPTADVPLPPGSRTISDLSYHLLTVTVHNSRNTAVF
jgi:hypothetical protein